MHWEVKWIWSNFLYFWVWDYEKDAEETSNNHNIHIFHNCHQLRSKVETEKKVAEPVEEKKMTNENYDDSDKKDANVNSDTHNIEQSPEEPDRVVRTYILVCTLDNSDQYFKTNLPVASNGPTTCLPGLQHDV